MQAPLKWGCTCYVSSPKLAFSHPAQVREFSHAALPLCWFMPLMPRCQLWGLAHAEGSYGVNSFINTVFFNLRGCFQILAPGSLLLCAHLGSICTALCSVLHIDEERAQRVDDHQKQVTLGFNAGVQSLTSSIGHGLIKTNYASPMQFKSKTVFFQLSNIHWSTYGYRNDFLLGYSIRKKGYWVLILALVKAFFFPGTVWIFITYIKMQM